MNETLNADCNVLVASGESQEYPPSQLTRRMSQIALSVAGLLANECNPNNAGLALSQSLYREQRGIDGTKQRARAEYDGKPLPLADVNVSVPRFSGTMSPRSLDH